MLVAKDRPTTNTHLLSWVDEMASSARPTASTGWTAPTRRTRR